MLFFVILNLNDGGAYMAIDTHTHVNSLMVSDVSKSIELINKDDTLSNVINVGVDIETSRESVNIANNNSKFYSTVGIHPLYVGDKYDDYRELDSLYHMITGKVVAIGEIGLDIDWGNYSEKNILNQKIYLIEQINLANSLGLPVVIHSSNANKQVIEVFEKYVKPQYGCVFHCFQPDLEDLEYIVSNGFYISFAGKITYKTAKKSIDVLKAVPDDLFLVETDSPYICPEPFKRDDINCSSNLHFIIDRIADLKEVSSDSIEKLTEDNAKKLFKRMK